MKKRSKPVESYTFAGMETAVQDQAQASAVYQAEELAAEFKKPLGDIDRKAARMEEDSPLFFGKVNPTLF